MRLLSVLTFLCLPFLIVGQSYVITGELRSTQNEPIVFASVVLSGVADSVMVKAGTTDNNGEFRLAGIPNGEYFLSAISVGYSKYNSPVITVAGKDMRLPGVVMEEESIALEGVTIKAERPMIEVMPDKTVFNVENAGSTAGLSGFELLRRAPGVVIDNNNNLIVEGKSGVQIWIDGKPSVLSGDDLVQYLRSLQASDIESIEVITQPSSKYDAEGTAGIINIKLRRDKRYGTNGTVSLGTGYGEYYKLNGSLALNNRTKRTNTFFNYGNNFGESFNYMNFDQQILDINYRERSRSVRDYEGHNLKAGVDVYAGKKSTVGVIVNGNLSDGGSTNRSTTTIVPIGASTPDAILRAQSIDVYDNTNIFLNGNYRYEDTLGYTFSVDIDYGTYESDRVNDQPNTYFNGDESEVLFIRNYQMVTPLQITIQSIKADYEQNLAGGKLGLGVKGVQVRTENSFDFYEEMDGQLEFQPFRSNAFDYTEDVLAAYVNYSYRKDKWNLQAGLRAENTHSLGLLESELDIADGRVERDYLNLFPSGGVTYQVNDINTLSMNYSRRINRPDYGSLNPFEFRLNELGFRKGNPFLQPNYTDNLKLSHTHNYKLTTSVSYSYVRDFYAQVTDTVDFQTTFIQARNVANEEVFAINVSYPFDVAEWWSVYVNLSASQTSYTSIDPKFNPITQRSYNAYGQNTFKLPKDWNFEVSGWFSGPSVWGGTFITQTQGALDLAVNRKFFDDQLTFSLSYSDIFYTAPWRATGEFNDIQVVGDGGWESRVARVNFSYIFGNPELKANRRKTGTEEEIQRIN